MAEQTPEINLSRDLNPSCRSETPGVLAETLVPGQGLRLQGHTPGMGRFSQVPLGILVHSQGWGSHPTLSFYK